MFYCSFPLLIKEESFHGITRGTKIPIRHSPERIKCSHGLARIHRKNVNPGPFLGKNEVQDRPNFSTNKIYPDPASSLQIKIKSCRSLMKENFTELGLQDRPGLVKTSTIYYELRSRASLPLCGQILVPSLLLSTMLSLVSFLLSPICCYIFVKVE